MPLLPDQRLSIREPCLAQATPGRYELKLILACYVPWLAWLGLTYYCT
jgi:hypothetical protein